MHYIKGNIYANPILRFSIEKPADWTFLPGEWTGNTKETVLENAAELKDAIAASSIPFVYFYKNHDEAEYPCPTVQCICRINRGYDLQSQFAEIPVGLMELLPTSDLIECTADYIISGQRALYFKFKFSFANPAGMLVECLGRTVVIFRPDYIFTVGLTGSVSGKYLCEEEFTGILQSIMVGNQFR